MRAPTRLLSPVFFASLLFPLLLTSCGAEVTDAHPVQTPVTQTQTVEPIPTSTPLVAPDANPLTGHYVADGSLLDLPALLVSISHFPVEARPQAGLSFASWVFEIYITEGATRFLATYHGDFPEPEIPLSGECIVRGEPLQQTSNTLGNRVWLDENGNNIQDDWERGIGGICVTLYDESGTPFQQTSTNSNGFYGFNVEAGRYVLVFQKPAWMEFVQKNSGNENQDSDADQVTGQAEVVEITSSNHSVDAGLILPSDAVPISELPVAKVGPVRSGRLVYADIAAFFPESCLVYAFASPEVLEELPICFFVTHDIQGGGYMLEISQIEKLAYESKRYDVDYASNVFDLTPLTDGVGASRLHVYTSYLNQSAWVYDAASESYWRYVDNADPDTAGIVHPEVDRLTGRQLQFENVIVLFAEHDVVSPTNLDIHLEEERTGDAFLFRDGRMYDITWSTQLSDEEVQTGRHKPIKFMNAENNTLMPLKPGHTWILVVTPETSVTERSPGRWLLEFVAPAGSQ